VKTSKEFFDRLRTDKDFADEISVALQQKREVGAKSYYETLIPVANERGYELSREDIDSAFTQSADEMSEEELGKIAGGTSCLPATLGVSASITILSIATAISATMELTD